MSGSVGYSGKPLWQKLGLRPGLRCAFVDPPSDYAALVGRDLDDLPTPPAPEPLDVVHLFVRDTAQLERTLDTWQTRLADGGMMWLSWPKKSSRLFVDLTEDGIRAVALPRGLVDVKVCAVDADWSGLKLMRRRTPR